MDTVPPRLGSPNTCDFWHTPYVLSDKFDIPNSPNFTKCSRKIKECGFDSLEEKIRRLEKNINDMRREIERLYISFQILDKKTDWLLAKLTKYRLELFDVRYFELIISLMDENLNSSNTETWPFRMNRTNNNSDCNLII